MALLFFIKALPGPLARRIQLQDAFFSFFTEIGSRHARDLLAIRLNNAATDPAAEQFRAETGDPNPLTLEDVHGSLQRAIATSGNRGTRLVRIAINKRAERETRELRRHVSDLRVFVEEVAQRQVMRQTPVMEEMMQRNGEALAARFESVLLRVIGARLVNQTMSICAHISTTVQSAVQAGMALKKTQAKRASASAAALPENQRASNLQAGPMSLGLSTVALGINADIPFLAWKSVRSSFGHHAKAERVRRHLLGPAHTDYIAQPLLWGYVGPTVEGGGARYIYLQEQREMLEEVLTRQRDTSAAQRAAGAPRPTESLIQRIHRLAAGLTAAERAVPWPVHASEFESHWDDQRVD